MTDQELHELAEEIQTTLPNGYQTWVVDSFALPPITTRSVGIHLVDAKGHSTGCIAVFETREEWNKFQNLLYLWSQKSLESEKQIVNAEVFCNE